MPLQHGQGLLVVRPQGCAVGGALLHVVSGQLHNRCHCRRQASEDPGGPVRWAEGQAASQQQADRELDPRIGTEYGSSDERVGWDATRGQQRLQAQQPQSPGLQVGKGGGEAGRVTSIWCRLRGGCKMGAQTVQQLLQWHPPAAGCGSQCALHLPRSRPGRPQQQQRAAHASLHKAWHQVAQLH